jgi:hypothetical protein
MKFPQTQTQKQNQIGGKNKRSDILDYDDKRGEEIALWVFIVLVGALGLLDEVGVWNGYALISSIVGISEDDITLILLFLILISIGVLHSFGSDEEYRPHSFAWKNQESNSEQKNPKSEEDEPEQEADANWWAEETGE